MGMRLLGRLPESSSGPASWRRQTNPCRIDTTADLFSSASLSIRRGLARRGVERSVPMQSIATTVSTPKGSDTKVLVGRSLSALVTFLMIFDGVMKVIAEPHVL